MNPYPYLRPLLFAMEPEMAHDATLKALKVADAFGVLPLAVTIPENCPTTVMGLNFPNPVGLAAGLDKNGDCIDALAALGFGFIEIGTVTPRAQSGNPKPRLFRLADENAIINRMGFNNLGMNHLLARVQNRRHQGILGINIGKNFDTPIEKALDDYLFGLRKAYPHASYITINISSPNTKNLRQLQQQDESRALIAGLKAEQLKLSEELGKYVPIALKIAPDLSAEDIERIAELLLEYEVDGVIATNTTIDRQMLAGHPLANETGGLSGAPLKQKSTAVVKGLYDTLQGKIPIIAAGGILSAQDAQEKIDAGAALVQIYSGLIYKGPALIKEISDHLGNRARQNQRS